MTVTLDAPVQETRKTDFMTVAELPAVNARRLGIYLVFVLAVMTVVAIHGSHYSVLNYRDDEIRNVYAGTIMSPVEVVHWISIDIHPPLWILSTTTWVSWFGTAEPVARWLSSLYVFIGMALLFRLMLDRFDWQVGAFAVILYGTNALFMFFGPEVRPYAMLTMFVAGSHLMFLRWLRKPSFNYALLYVIFGVASLYTHFFSVFVIAGQFVAFIILTRWDRGLYLRAFGLFAAIGLSFLGWILPFLHVVLVVRSGGIDYGIRELFPDPEQVYRLLQVRPTMIATLLLAVGILVPVRYVLRQRDDLVKRSPRLRFKLGVTNKWYFIIVALTIGLVGLWVDLNVTVVLTLRNLLTMLVAAMVILALGVRAFPWQARLVILAFVVYIGASDYYPYFIRDPLRETYAFIEDSDPPYTEHEPIIMSIDRGWPRYFAFWYYYEMQMPGRVDQFDMFFLSRGKPWAGLPEVPVNVIVDASPENLVRFRELISDADRVWWLATAQRPDHTQTYLEVLQREFELHRREDIKSLQHRVDSVFLEFRRRGVDFSSEVSASNDQ